jgi:hypothetical protein
MPISSEAAKYRAEVGGYERRHNPEGADEARAKLKFAVLADRIHRDVTSAPLPSAEQLARLRALLRPGGGSA